MTFTTLFYRNIMLRHSCGKCYYTNLQRPSDITLADFWGWEKNVPDMNKDDKGISLILLNTPKGVHVFDIVKKDLFTKSVDLKQALQPNLMKPSEISLSRMKFEEDYGNYGFAKTMKLHGMLGWRCHKNEIIHEIKEYSKFVKNRIKKIVKFLLFIK